MDLYLSNAASWRTDHGPGRKWLIMAIPPDYSGQRWGVCLAGMPPSPQHVAGVRSGRILPDDYRAACCRRWRQGLDGGHLRPGSLMGYEAVPWYVHQRREAPWPVAPGDTLLCGCARLGSPRWERPCHRQWLAWWLAAAGWSPILDGVRCAWRSPPSSAAPFAPDPLSHRDRLPAAGQALLPLGGAP